VWRALQRILDFSLSAFWISRPAYSGFLAWRLAYSAYLAREKSRILLLPDSPEIQDSVTKGERGRDACLPLVRFSPPAKT